MIRTSQLNYIHNIHCTCAGITLPGPRFSYPQSRLQTTQMRFSLLSLTHQKRSHFNPSCLHLLCTSSIPVCDRCKQCFFGFQVYFFDNMRINVRLVPSIKALKTYFIHVFFNRGVAECAPQPESSSLCSALIQQTRISCYFAAGKHGEGNS